MYDCAQARPRMQRISVFASFQKIPSRGSVKVRTRLVSRIGPGPHLVGRVGSEVWVSDIFHILSCVVICVVARSGFRDTLSTVVTFAAWNFHSRLSIAIGAQVAKQ